MTEPLSPQPLPALALEGLSQRTLEEHYKLYREYVNRANELRVRLAALDRATPPAPLSRDLGQILADLTGTLNAIRNHELYFANLGGRGGRAYGRVAQGLGCEPVLAVRAVVIAAEHAEGQGFRAGQQVEEGLLLGRVELEGTDVAPGGIEGSALVEPDLTDSAEAVQDNAPVAAGRAPDFVIGQPLVEESRPGPPVEDVGQGRLKAGLCPGHARSPFPREIITLANPPINPSTCCCRSRPALA